MGRRSSTELGTRLLKQDGYSLHPAAITIKAAVKLRAGRGGGRLARRGTLLPVSLDKSSMRFAAIMQADDDKPLFQVVLAGAS